MYTTSRLQIPIFKISTRLREILETDPCQNLTSPWLKNTYFYQCKHFYSLQTREEQSHNTDVLERLWYCLLQHYLFHFSLLFSKITYGVRRICRIKQGHLASPNTNIIQSDVLGFFKQYLFLSTCNCACLFTEQAAVLSLEMVSFENNGYMMQQKHGLYYYITWSESTSFFLFFYLGLMV